MATPATVREWHDAEGWGVVDSEATPGGCWAHFSDVAVAGYRNLQPGAGVRLEWEVADQDGYRFRAVRVWPEGELPVEQPTDDRPSGAYTSRLTITWPGASAGGAE